ncbi:MAG: outer membrane protein assembly factor BamD, partial [Alphaproteobacteria bacterium]|nr:outer membrane protein assembly factor BamD [Alphaproteobacteria bacterium]
MGGSSLRTLATMVEKKVPRAAGLAFLLAAGLLLSGCSSSLLSGILGDEDKATSTSTSSTGGLGHSVAPELGGSGEQGKMAELYNKGLSQIREGEYKSAFKSFSEVERQYPYSAWATKSILMQAYANYEAGKMDDCIVAANRFITLHPGHKDAPYAYYLVALANYNRISDTKRDQTVTQKALNDLEEVQRRFPGTRYAEDA